MSICKFKIGDLVKHWSRREYWSNKLGLVVRIKYEHGDPSFGVKWGHLDRVRYYKKNRLRKCDIS